MCALKLKQYVRVLNEIKIQKCNVNLDKESKYDFFGWGMGGGGGGGGEMCALKLKQYVRVLNEVKYKKRGNSTKTRFSNCCMKPGKHFKRRVVNLCTFLSIIFLIFEMN